MRRIGIAGPGAVALLGLLLACNEAGSGGGVPPAAQATPSLQATAAAQDPAVSQVPAAAQDPAVSQAPAAAQDPAVSQAPAAAQGPAVSEAPAVAQGPAVSLAPAVAQDTPPVPGGRMGRGGMMGGRGMMGQGGMMGSMVRGQADTAATPQVQAAAATAPDCPPISQALVNQGRSIFTRVGNCAACHGSDAQGTPIAPSLTDSRWLDTNGSYAGIAGIVRDGVARPKRSPAPMPQKGGAALDAGQVCAVAAYVYSLSHTGG